MFTKNCYAGYTWRVVQNNRFVGYVVALSQWDAIRIAGEKYGKNIWVERMVAP